jgi:hypothetical protein
MANQRLSLTRDQFASFLQDFEQIKQFERLFANTNANVISIDDVSLAAGNSGASANDALAQIIGISETLNKEPAPANVSQLAVIETQLTALDVAPPASNGSVTSVAASGGTTGLSFSGSPITTSGTLTLGGTLAVVNGGTGQTSYTDGQLLIGNTTGNTLTKATLSAGSGVSITNGAGSITISATGSGGTVTSVGQTFTGGLISVAGSPITTSGTLALTVAGTSGGIPYFSSGATWATSAVLAANAIVVGGGAGLAPATVTTGTGVVTALGVNVGTAGSFIVNGGALGTPSSGTVTNLTGTASMNINGTVGATTPTTGAFTSVSLTAGFALAWNADVGLSRSAAGTLNLGDGTAGTSSGTLVLAKTTFAGNANLTSPSLGNLQLGTGATTGAGGSLSLTNLTASGTVSANSLTLTTALSVGNGGTGATTITSGRLVKANGASAFSASLVYDDGTNSGIVSGNFVIDAGSLQTKSNGSTALANALNDNVVITVGTGFMTFTGGGALAQLGGMVAGANGQRVVILNTTGSGITVIGESATSTAANRIWTQGLNPATWNNLGSREFIYSTAQSRWLMIGSNAG